MGDYYCSCGFLLGFSGDFMDISGGDSKWNQFLAMFTCPMKGVGAAGGGGGGLVHLAVIRPLQIVSVVLKF